MFCIKCGCQNADGAAFCCRCGAPIWVPPAGAAPVRPAQPPVSKPAPQEPPRVIKPQAEWTPGSPSFAPSAPAEQAPKTPAAPLFDAPTAAPEQPPKAPAAPLFDEPIATPEQPPKTPAAPLFDAPIAAPEQPQKPPVPPAPTYTPPAPTYTPQAYAPVRTPPTQPGYAPPAPPKQKKKERPTPSTGIKALTVVLCVLFAFFFLLSSTIGIVRNLLSEQTVETVAENTELDSVVLDIDGEEYTLAEWIYENLTEEMRPIFTVRTIERILDEPEVRDFAAETLLGYTEFFTDNRPLHAVDAEDIVDFLKDESDLLEDNAGYTLTRRDFETIEISLNENFDFRSIDRTGLSGTVGIDIELLQFLLSPLGYGISIALCVLLLALIFLANRENVFACLGKLFCTFLVLGSLYLLIAAGAFGVSLFAGSGLLALFRTLLGSVALFYVLRGAVLFVVGLVGTLIRHAQRKRAKAKAE